MQEAAQDATTQLDAPTQGATQLDAPTQGESQDASGPDPKRHKANESLDPFVGGGTDKLVLLRIAPVS